MDTRLIFRDYLGFRCGDAAWKTLCAMVTRGVQARLGQVNPPGRLPGKAAKVRTEVSVPQTDTGGRDEYSKALG
jgi:hypothetical protein